MDPAPFAIDVSEDGDRTVVRVTGELDLATSPQLRETCAKVIGTGSREIRLDMTGVSFLDSSGISVLVQAHKDLEHQGAVLVLTGLGESARRVLEVAGLGEYFRRGD